MGLLINFGIDFFDWFLWLIDGFWENEVWSMLYVELLVSKLWGVDIEFIVFFEIWIVFLIFILCLFLNVEDLLFFKRKFGRKNCSIVKIFFYIDIVYNK